MMGIHWECSSKSYFKAVIIELCTLSMKTDRLSVCINYKYDILSQKLTPKSTVN